MISTMPIFLLGRARMRLSVLLATEQRPLGLGHVSSKSNTLKSTKLNTNTLVSSAITHLSCLSLTARTSLLQLVSTTHFMTAELIGPLTVVPYHHFVLRVPGSLAAADNR